MRGGKSVPLRVRGRPVVVAVGTSVVRRSIPLPCPGSLPCRWPLPAPPTPRDSRVESRRVTSCDKCCTTVHYPTLFRVPVCTLMPRTSRVKSRRATSRVQDFLGARPSSAHDPPRRTVTVETSSLTHPLLKSSSHVVPGPLRSWTPTSCVLSSGGKPTLPTTPLRLSPDTNTYGTTTTHSDFKDPSPLPVMCNSKPS